MMEFTEKRLLYQNLLIHHQSIIEAIGDVIVKRLRNKHIRKMLRPITGNLDTADWEYIEKKGQWIHLSGRETLFKIDECDTGVFVLLNGHLRATKKHPVTKQAITEDIYAGEIVGERAFFTGHAHWKTVTAMRDSDLLKFGTNDFEALIEKYPQIMRACCKSMVEQLDSSLHHVRPHKHHLHIAVIAHSKDVPLNEFCQRLSQEIHESGMPCIHMNADYVDRSLNFPGASQIPSTSPFYSRYCIWRDEHQDEYDVFLSEADLDDTEWTKRCMRHADQVLILANAHSDPALNHLEKEMINTKGKDALFDPYQRLILIHPDGSRPPKNTERWISLRSINQHHHVRWDRETDIQSLARFITGNTVGLVLGSGGARGFAHFGVIRALEESGVAIDYVGGCSFGALVGACFSYGLPYEKSIERIKYMMDHSFDYTLPLVSLTKGLSLAQMLHQDFGDTTIADLWVPYFAISCNLSQANTHVHRQTSLVDALRATMSIPGVFPPVVRNGDLLVDGALLNTLPISVMHDLLEQQGVVIAVDISEEARKASASFYGKGLSGWSVLWSRLNPFKKPLKIPSLASLLYCIGDLGHAQAIREIKGHLFDTDILITPNVKHYKLFDSDQAEDIVEEGYQATKKILEEQKKDPEE